VEIRPFNGIVYDWDKLQNVGLALAPPYDVINPDQQEALYQSHPHNVVRLILGKQSPADSDSDSRYTRAARDLAEWMEQGILRPYPEPALYIYSQEYQIEGVRLNRIGFICRLKLEEYGQGMIFPHERTLSGPKTDRLNLTRACRMNFSQIFGLYEDPQLTLDTLFEVIIKNSKPAVEAEQDGVIHRMWPVADKDFIEKVHAFMADKDMVIADGHHRYETALNYRNERREQAGGAGGEYDYGLVFLSNTHGQGFTVLPTHRFVLKADKSAEEALATLAGDFEISEERRVTEDDTAGFMEELKRAGEQTVAFGMYTGGGAMRLLRLKKETQPPSPPGAEKIEALRWLDVTILQELILSRALDITREKVEAGGHIYYTIHADLAMRKVDEGTAKMAFLMNPTGIGQVMEVACGGGTMPQKSTYFYPKLISGLVFNPL